jgi:hypothetical protein
MGVKKKKKKEMGVRGEFRVWLYTSQAGLILVIPASKWATKHAIILFLNSDN